jgi:AraC-like DNA-binding protein
MTIWISIFTIILSLITLYFNKGSRKTYGLFTGYLILFSLYAITHYLVFFGRDPNITAIFWNHLSPFWVLAGPLIYFYVKFTINDYSKWKWVDLLHLIPSLIILIGVFPYYFIPFSEKVKIITQIQNNLSQMTTFRMNILLPNFTLLLSRPLIIALYLIYSAFVIYKKFRYGNLNTSQYKLMFKWLLTIIIISFISILNLEAIGVNLVLTTLFNNYRTVVELHIFQVVLFSSLPIAMILFPKIMYGMPSILKHKLENENILSNSTFIFNNQVAFENLSKQIINFINDQCLFLKKDFTINTISTYFKIPQNQIDHCFCNVLKVDFDEFICKKRVEYAQTLVADSTTRKFSMDKISDLSGFSSRSDFYKACKQHLGLIPLNEEWHEILLILQHYFDGGNGYLQTGFKLEDLSNDTKIPAYILSEFINNFYNMNFNEFVNDKRLSYLQKQLQFSFEYQQYSINAIGPMLGFKSKSSFFTAIKKKSGLSPSEFIKHFSHRKGD